jgi:hypothetical protein
MARQQPDYYETAGVIDELVGDMNRADLVYALQNLSFDKGKGCTRLIIDREVRDYLLRKIQQR